MKNIQVQSPTLQITESDKEKEYLGISEVQTFSSSDTKKLICWIQIVCVKIKNLV